MALPYMRWFPSDYLAATAHLSLTEDAVYRRLIDLLWMEGGSVPSDHAWLSSRLRVPRSVLKKSWPAIRDLIEDDGTTISQRRVKREHQRATDRSTKARESASSRWSSDANALRSHSEGSANQNQIPEPDTKPNDARARAKAPPVLDDPIAEQEAQVLQAFEAAFGRMVMPGPATRYLRERLEGGGTVDQALAVIEHVRASGRHVGTPQDCFNSRIWNAIHAAPIEPRRRSPDGTPVTRQPRAPEPPSIEIDPAAEEAWARIVEAAQIDPQSKDTWLRPTFGARLHRNGSGGTLLDVVVPSQAFHDWIRTRLSEPLAAASREQGIEKLACVVGRPARQETVA